LNVKAALMIVNKPSCERGRQALPIAGRRLWCFTLAAIRSARDTGKNIGETQGK
jgi:hypothetical protein